MKLYYYTYNIEGKFGEGYIADCFGKTVRLGVIENDKIYEEFDTYNCAVDEYLSDEIITDWVEL